MNPASNIVALIACSLVSFWMCGSYLARPSINPPPGSDNAPSNRLIQSQLDCLKAVTGDPEDLGSVQANSLIQRRVTFVNTSSHTVRLKVMTTTCGCLSSMFSNDLVPQGASTILTLSVLVAPAMGAQTQSVTFSAAWDTQAGPREQRGVCFIRYAADIDFDVFPDRFSFVVVHGEQAFGRVWARWADAKVESRRFQQVSCTFPNTTVLGPFMPEDTPTIRAYTFTISSPDVGLHVGHVNIETGTPDRPEIKLPVSVRVLASWRLDPAGAVLRANQWQVTIKLTARTPAAPAPSSVLIVHDTAPVVAELRWPKDDRSQPPELIVSSKQTPADYADDGATRVVVRDADGRTLVSVPVAWFATPERALQTK